LADCATGTYSYSYVFFIVGRCFYVNNKEVVKAKLPNYSAWNTLSTVGNITTISNLVRLVVNPQSCQTFDQISSCTYNNNMVMRLVEKPTFILACEQQ
jgi:hypothetical protein